MNDPNITMEEYIRLEEEKLRKRAIVFNDALTSEVTPSCEPTISPLNDNKIDFRMLCDESDDEDYTPTVSYFDDLDFFKDFEKEFPAIVYNDALTSKLDFLTEPTGKESDRGGDMNMNGGYGFKVKRGDLSSEARIPVLTTLFSFSDENGSKVSITGKGGSQMNEKENSSGDRNIMDWTPMNIPGSKIFRKEKKLQGRIRGNH
ncbi:hypothetical protein Tco_1284584 [Tanacetum coccineum]